MGYLNKSDNKAKLSDFSSFTYIGSDFLLIFSCVFYFYPFLFFTLNFTTTLHTTTCVLLLSTAVKLAFCIKKVSQRF